MNDLKPKEILPPELIELTDQIGLFIEYWGFKKIHGQIWSHIFLSKTPLDATTLVKRLGVSKALVSLAIKDLVQYDVIQVVGQGEKRTILFQSNPDLISVIT
ncbi:MAG: GbsR/MarR family transcriptional regulator, partial [Pseudobdellovibrionaceae bacterium]